MWRTIDELYSGNIACENSASGFDIVGRLYQMEHHLLEWEGNLPIHLRPRGSQHIPSEEDADSCERFRVILALRYHNLRILIHRPILVKFLDIAGSHGPDDRELMLLQQVGTNSMQQCVQSSMEIIAIVNQIVHSSGMRRRFLGAWWFSLYYSMISPTAFLFRIELFLTNLITAFHAALVIFATSLVCQKPSLTSLTSPTLSVPLEVLRKCMDQAVDALAHLDTGNRMVERCCKYLEKMGHVLDLLGQFQTFEILSEEKEF